MRGERLLVYGLALVVLGSPLPFGSVRRSEETLLLVVCLLLGVVWIAWRAGRALPVLPWREPVLLAGALLTSLWVAQSLPLPRAALERISPTSVTLRDRYEPQALGAWGVSYSQAAAFRGWRPISMHPWATRRSGIRLLAFLVAALIAVDLTADPRSAKYLAVALAAGGAFQALYGLAEYFSGRQHIFGYAKRHYTDVATGTFINRNHFAGFLEMTLPMVVALAALACPSLRSERGRGILSRLAGSRGPETFGTAVLLILSLTMAVALLCSGSRAGIASATLAVLTTATLLYWRRRGRGFAVFSVLVVGGAFVLLVQAGATPLLNSFQRIADEMQGELGRWRIWDQALRVLADFPLLGVGLGAFGNVFPMFRTGGEGKSLPHAHSDVLEAAVETGLVGCCLLVVAIVLVTRSLLRHADGDDELRYFGHASVAGLIAIGFHSMADFNLSIPANAVTLAILVGMAVGCHTRGWPKLVPASPRRMRLRAVVPAAIMLLAALCAAAPVLGTDQAGLSAGLLPRASVPELPFSGPAGALVRVLDGDNPERYFDFAAAIGEPAIRDAQALRDVGGGLRAPSADALRYVDSRLTQATHLQAIGLRFKPTSSKEHAAMGRLMAASCAVLDLAGGSASTCLSGALEEFNRAITLNPMGARLHAQVGWFIASNWSHLDAGQRSRFAPVVERAIEMNPEEAHVMDAWRAIRNSRPGEVAER